LGKYCHVYVINYFAHAASVPSEPEAKGSPSIGQWKLGSNLQWKLAAALLPFTSLVQSLIWISNTLDMKDRIIQALGVGAMMVAGRSESWKPHTQGQWIYVNFPKPFEELDENFVLSNICTHILIFDDKCHV